MEGKFGIYDEFIKTKCDLEIGLMMMETVLLNGKNEDVNRYLEKAMLELRKALSYMSDAEFELFTSPPEMFEG